MSLSGIAIAIGVLVDAGIVMAENVVRHAERSRKGQRPPAERCGNHWRSRSQRRTQVGRPIFFAMLIIILAFVPVFALTGQEGKLFHPLAFTKTFAMAGAAILAVTLVPALCALFMRGPFQDERQKSAHARAARDLRSDSRLGAALAENRGRTGRDFAGGGADAGVWRAAPSCLKNFQPSTRNLRPNSARLGQRIHAAAERRQFAVHAGAAAGRVAHGSQTHHGVAGPVIKQTPEVESVAGKLGRAETATDPAPVQMIETTIMLKPESEWRPGMTEGKTHRRTDRKTCRRCPATFPDFSSRSKTAF